MQQSGKDKNPCKDAIDDLHAISFAAWWMAARIRW